MAIHLLVHPKRRSFPNRGYFLVLTLVLNVALTTLMGQYRSVLLEWDSNFCFLWYIQYSASRIWWVSRKTRKDVPSNLHHRYNGTLMILFVLLFLFPFCNLTSAEFAGLNLGLSILFIWSSTSLLNQVRLEVLALSFKSWIDLFTLVQMILDIGLIHIVGIMPTLILAQVCLGCTFQDVEAELNASMSQFCSTVHHLRSSEQLPV